MPPQGPSTSIGAAMGGRSLRIAFVMDPIELIDPAKDTTFVFMLEAERRGHLVHYLQAHELYVEAAAACARSRRVEVRRGRPHFSLHEARSGPLEWFDVVFMRRDPPVDLSYYLATQLLSLVDPRRTFVINDPRGLREANEKLYVLNFPTVIPEHLVSADTTQLKDFLAAMGEMIIKPLERCGGAGVFYIRRDDPNLNVLLEVSTDNGRRPVMAQRYLPEARSGDKRVIVLAGRPLGATLRVPPAGEHRGNIHVGSRCEPAALTERDVEICAALAPRLCTDGLYFVGLDIIGGYLTEVNVTSPTGVQEIDALSGLRIEADVLDFVEERAAALERA